MASGSIRTPAPGRWGTKILVRVGMLGAVAFALMYAEFNLPYFPVFLQYDPGDVPAVIGGFAMGPIAGAAISLIKAVIFFLSGKDEAGLLGTTANLAWSLAFVVTAAAVYTRVHTRRGAVLGLGAGLVAMLVVMAFLNAVFFLPAYGIPAAAIPSTLKLVILFNLVKGTITSLVAFVIYKRVSPFLHS